MIERMGLTADESNRFNSDHDPDAVSLRCSAARYGIKTLRNNGRILIGALIKA